MLIAADARGTQLSAHQPCGNRCSLCCGLLLFLIESSLVAHVYRVPHSHLKAPVTAGRSPKKIPVHSTLETHGPPTQHPSSRKHTTVVVCLLVPVSNRPRSYNQFNSPYLLFFPGDPGLESSPLELSCVSGILDLGPQNKPSSTRARCTHPGIQLRLGRGEARYPMARPRRRVLIAAQHALPMPTLYLGGCCEKCWASKHHLMRYLNLESRLCKTIICRDQVPETYSAKISATPSPAPHPQRPSHWRGVLIFLS
ncbi:hypothetical protein P154DRAFT_233923 [Amniculicola lignicola CBS 123094]|uniref:C2H2-type domain-containing protein n=1 Tax=Amniculicola lignicola CBS 123094 TaxID=1392246 RepID=A0A6A5WDB4_9PLEO|nr:hypothetical protein P154DRAFT_233923 [Amniculicola lignicola CBS 123094]